MEEVPKILDFSTLTRDAIASLLQQYHLNLTVDEALTLQNMFLKRPPTLAECILWSIQNADHCLHKNSRKHLKQLLTTGSHVMLEVKEDAGIIAVATDHAGRRYGVVVSHQSHHPALFMVPEVAAALAVGDNVCAVSAMGAEVIAVANSVRFGDIHKVKTRSIHQGVVAGISSYTNALGVPHIAGDVYYHAAYQDNDLVTTVALGIVREDHIIHSYIPKLADHHVLILVGKPTQVSDFCLANGSSYRTLEQKTAENKGGVQEPNALLQRHLLKANDALFEILREKKLLDQVGCKGLSIGGIARTSLAFVESAGYGAEINLDHVPISTSDLPSELILYAETPERFMWAVPPDLVEMILAHYNEMFALPQVSPGAGAAVIGKIRSDGYYIVRHHGKEIVNAKAHAMTQNMLHDRPFAAAFRQLSEPRLSIPNDFNAVLLQLLAHENIASRSPIFETYDKQVQGRSLMEPGWADAGVMQPFNDETYPFEMRKVGIALSLDHNPRYNQIDAYWGAVNAVVEAVRNVVATGASPLAITTGLCFANPEYPEHMQAFVASIRGINEATRAITLFDYSDTLPMIAGHVSFYNESAQGAIPPTPIVSCIGSLADVAFATSVDFKQTNSLIFLVGDRKEECGGSVYYQLHDELGAQVPKPDLETIASEIHAVQMAISQGFVLAAHNISQGGVAVALAEMSFKNSIGAVIEVPGDCSLVAQLFGETGGFILEVARDKAAFLRAVFADYEVCVMMIGETKPTGRLQMNGVIDVAVAEAKAKFAAGLREKLSL